MWHPKHSSVSLALIRSPTQKSGMDLVVKLQAMQQLITSVTFFPIRRVQSQEYGYRTSLIFYYSSIVVIIIIIIICQVTFELNHQALQTERWLSLTYFYLIRKCMHDNVSFHVPGELIIIGWTFMDSIYCLLSSQIFLNSQQLIQKRKIEKQNVSLDIKHETPVQLETFICLNLRKNIFATKLKIFLFHPSNIVGFTLSFWIRYICVAQIERKFENQGLITGVKNICTDQ